MKGDVEVRRNGSLLILRTPLGKNSRGKNTYSYTVEIRNCAGIWEQSPNNPFTNIFLARAEASRLDIEHAPPDPVQKMPKAELDALFIQIDNKIKGLSKRRDRIQIELERRAINAK